MAWESSIQRRHVREAVTFFSNALKTQPNYAPALLNFGIVTQPFDRAGALQHYRNYLALNPTAPNAGAVREVIQQIERESVAMPPRATNQVPAVGPHPSPDEYNNDASPDFGASNNRIIVERATSRADEKCLAADQYFGNRCRRRRAHPTPSLKGAEQLARRKNHGRRMDRPFECLRQRLIVKPDVEVSRSESADDPASKPPVNAAPGPPRTFAETPVPSDSIDPHPMRGETTARVPIRAVPRPLRKNEVSRSDSIPQPGSARRTNLRR